MHGKTEGTIKTKLNVFDHMIEAKKEEGQKDVKLARFDLMPPDTLIELSEHYGNGLSRYSERNWEKGYLWSKSYAALQRHAHQFWSGKDRDSCDENCQPKCSEHTGSKHLIAVAWHAITLANFMENHKDKDDRPTTLSDEKQS